METEQKNPSLARDLGLLSHIAYGTHAVQGYDHEDPPSIEKFNKNNCSPSSSGFTALTYLTNPKKKERKEEIILVRNKTLLYTMQSDNTMVCVQLREIM